MSATKYQVMYRYMNAIMNVAITNDQSNAYESVCEFYTDPDHRIFSTDPNIQNEELDKQQSIIVNANQSDNPKNDMLFVYAGTKKIPHQIFKPAETAYIVKHWELLPRSKIGNQGDFTKDFTTINAATVEDGGTVICTAAVMRKYFSAGTVVSSGNYTSAQMTDMLDSYSVFQLQNENWRDHINPCDKKKIYADGNTTNLRAEVHYGTIYIDGAEDAIQTYSGYVAGYYNPGSQTGIASTDPRSANVFNALLLDASDLETTEMPEHYEDSPENPYMIKDTYARIEDSPWMVNCITGSLTAALEKAKKIADVLGMENVKIVKLVEVDQFIKIR